MGGPRTRALLARIGWPLAAVGAIVAIAVLAPLIAPHDPVSMDVGARLAGSSASHWLGQDEFGRDVLSRLIWGARASLAVAIVSALVAGIIGVLLGLVGGYFGGIAELLTIRLTDVILSFPPILLALLIVTLAGPGTLTLILVLSLLYAPGYARVTYGEVLSTRQLEYVEAARASGAHPLRILLNTVLPNVAPPILVQFSLTVAGAILIESGLSFLGLGVVPPTPSWGLMIRGARASMEQNWLLLAWPCLALIVTILAVNRLCDALRDAFDPRLAGVTRAMSAAQAALSPAPVTGKVAPSAASLAATAADGTLLAVDTLRTHLTTPGGIVKAVDGVSFDIRRGETVALVGESGSGKSMTGLSLLGLMPKPAGRIVEGSIMLTGRDGRRRDLARLGELELQAIRGNEIAMIFQEPMTSLNPVYRVGWQIEEAVLRHQNVSRAEARAIAVRALDSVGIPDARRLARSYPHELSGGMRQRAMIAMALSSRPSLLIADEPTTALDVTIQAEILDLLRALQADKDRQLGLLFVTHNLGVVAEIADKVLVMYAGQIVEEADTRTLFRDPRHPYTIGLLASMPAARAIDVPSNERPPLQAIPGQVPSPLEMPDGCTFAPRCGFAEAACTTAMPALSEIAPGHRSRCRRWQEIGARVKEPA